MSYHVFEMIIIDNCLMREAVETVGGGASLASTTDRGTRSPPVGVDRREAEEPSVRPSSYSLKNNVKVARTEN